MADAKVWFPVSFLLVAVIYTGSKSLVRLFLLASTGHPLRGQAGQLTLTALLAIPVDPRLHHFQKPHHHPHRLRRSPLVRRVRHWPYPRLILFDGRLERHCRMVRYLVDPRPNLVRGYRRCGPYVRGRRSLAERYGRYWTVERWVLVDVYQLYCLGRLCSFPFIRALSHLCRRLLSAP